MARTKDNELIPFHHNLTGRCIPALDSAKLEFTAIDQQSIVSDHFSILKNLKYTDNGIAGIPGGMTQINTTALSSHPRIEAMFQFKKVQPNETHLLVHATNTAQTERKVFQNTTAIPSQGDFSATALHTDASGSDAHGRFSDAPDEHVAYCNSVETMVWGGDKTRVSNFTVYDPNGTFIYDYTTQVQNTLTDANNVATLKQVSGIGSETMVLFHFEDTAPFQSDDPGSTHSGVAVGGMDRSSVEAKFGTYSALFNGTSQYITITDHADMDDSAGVWTKELHVRLDDLAADHGLYAQAEEGWTQDYINIYIDTNGAIHLKIHESTTAATGTVTLNAGGSGSVDSVTVNGVTVTSGSEAFDNDLDTTAVNVAANITAHTSSPNYTATATSSVITITSDRKGADVNTYAVVSNTTTITSTDVNLANGASEDVVSLSTPNSVVSAVTQTHIRVVENSNDYYIFVNGIQKAHVSDSSRTEGHQTYDSTVRIGSVYDGTTVSKYFDGYIDEYRQTNSALSTGNFDVPSSAYTTATTNVNMRIGNTMPVDGFHFTISNANTSTGTMAVFYWASTGEWTAVTTLVDNTASGGIPLAQTGTVTFDSTANIAKPTIIDGIFGFWFKVEITDADTATAISHVTVSEPFQNLQDFWDGEFRVAQSVQLFEDNINKDNTINVLDDSFIFDTSTEGNTATYMQMDSLLLGTEYLQVGFGERQQGLRVKLIPDHVNTTANTIMTISYWNGASWISVGDLEDGTIDNNISFAKSGFVTWNPIARNTEFKKEINKESSLYYYKIEWSQNFTADVLCYFIAGVPVQTLISNYKFPIYAQGRLWLFSDQAEDKNQAIVSNLDELNTFNGIGAGDPIKFGDRTEIVAATELYERTSTEIQSNILVLKEHSVHVVEGLNPEEWRVTDITSELGCNGPSTLSVSTIGLEYAPLRRKQIAIWQGSSGIYMFDNLAVHTISDDINNLFDQTKAESINLALAHESKGFFEVHNGEHYWHWCFTSRDSSTVDSEWVLDLKRQKWFEIDRGAKPIYNGQIVYDTSGNIYNYASDKVGRIYRLNNGTDFDGADIVYTMAFGDTLPAGDINILTSVDSVRLMTVSKSNTANKIFLYHYGDTKDNATIDRDTKNAYYLLNTDQTGQRACFPFKRTNTPPHITHKLKFTITTNNETIGFEPLYVGGFYKLRGNAELNITN